MLLKVWLEARVSKGGQQGSPMLTLHILEWALFFSPLCWNFGAITVRREKLLMLIKAQSLKMPSSAPRLASRLLMYSAQRTPTEWRDRSVDCHAKIGI